MMTLEYKQSLTELNMIIHYMDIEYLKKIPEKFIDFIVENMDSNYAPNISKNIPLNEQVLKKDTKVLLSLLYRMYWCDNETKKELIKNDLISKEIYEKEQREKYNPNDIFKNKKPIVTENNIVLENSEQTNKMIEYKKEKWYKKIFAKILKIFKR